MSSNVMNRGIILQQRLLRFLDDSKPWHSDTFCKMFEMGIQHLESAIEQQIWKTF